VINLLHDACSPAITKGDTVDGFTVMMYVGVHNEPEQVV